MPDRPSDAEIARKERQLREEQEKAKKAETAAGMAKYAKFIPGVGTAAGIAVGAAAGAAAKREEREVQRREKEIERMRQQQMQSQSPQQYQQPMYGAPAPSGSGNFLGYFRSLIKKALSSPVAVFLLLGVSSIYLRMIGQHSLSFWLGFSAVMYIIVSLLFHEPHKGFIVLLLPVGIWLLQWFKMDTAANITFVIGITLTIILMAFDKTRQKAEQALSVLVYLLGAALLFTASALAQANMNVPYPHIITSILMLVYLGFLFTRKGAIKLIAILINILFFTVLFMAPSAFGPPGSPFYDAAIAQSDAWSSMFSGIAAAGQALGKEFQTSYLMGIGDYEQGVEAQSEKPLGVFLDNVGTTAQVVTLGDGDDTIDVFARLRTESFKLDEPFEVKVRCYPEGMDGDAAVAGRIMPGGKQIAVFEVAEYEATDIDCILNADDLGPGSFNVVLEAAFEFETDAFLKAYFMDQDRKRALDREMIPQGKSALDAFNIADKNPIAIFTGGPMKIGIGVSQQPVALLEPIQGESEAPGPTVSVTLDKNWLDGDLGNMTMLKIGVPVGMSVLDIDGKKVLCSPDEQGMSCSLEGAELEKVFGKSTALPKTMRVHTGVTSRDALLGNNPLAIRSFKVESKYVYRIKKVVSVNIRSGSK